MVKKNYSAPAATEIMNQVTKWDAVVTGVGDWGSCSSSSLHDSLKAEQLGIPAFAIMTSKFVSVADLMSRVLGAENFLFAVIDHLISSASELDLTHQAEQAVKTGIPLLMR